jgi:hypothetical protein
MNRRSPGTTIPAAGSWPPIVMTGPLGGANAFGGSGTGIFGTSGTGGLGGVGNGSAPFFARGIAGAGSTVPVPGNGKGAPLSGCAHTPGGNTPEPSAQGG